jgi:uncharacterized membrane protein YphA (DoxX/SURF4 family)
VRDGKRYESKRFLHGGRSADVHAYHVLHVAFCLIPIIAGFDKFFDKLARWDMYPLPAAANLLGAGVPIFMSVVGVIEIFAGLSVLFRPRRFA